MNERVLAWEGCTNVRDLGGLRTCDGRMTRWRAVVRSDSPARLTPAGWSALYAYGIRTMAGPTFAPFFLGQGITGKP